MQKILKNPISRRTLLNTAAIGAAAAVASPYIIRSAQAADEEITVLTWETYSEDAWLEEFGKANNVKMTAVRIGSVDEFFAKLTSGAVQPDVLYIDTSTIPRLRKMELLAPIDVSRIENAKNISPAIKYQNSNMIDGKLWALPYNWGPIPLMYNTEVVKEGFDSWKTLWDPKWKGRVSVADDSFNTLPMIALVAGAKNPYQLTDAEFTACAELLKTLRPQIKAMTTGNNDTQTLFGSGEVDIGLCMNPPIVVELKKAGKPIAYTVPKEGVSSWLDNAILTKKGDRDIVYKFLNAQLSLEWQKRFVEFTISPGVFDQKSALAQGVKPELIANTVMPLLDQPGVWDSLKFFQDLENTDRRLQLWNDFKAGTL